MFLFQTFEAFASLTAEPADRTLRHFCLATSASRHVPTTQVRTSLTKPPAAALLLIILGETALIGDDFLLSDAFTHLLSSKKTLRTFYLDVSPHQQASVGDSRRLSERLASLRSFPALRNLLLSSRLLDSISAGESAEDGSALTGLLPPSIVSLQVVAPKEMEAGPRLRLKTALFCLAEAVCQGRFPNLKNVSCYHQGFDGSGLAAMFPGAGVDFEYDACTSRAA